MLALLRQIGSWTLQWVPREQNIMADFYANRAATFKCDVDYGT